MPIYSIKIDQSQSLKEPSKICQHHIVLVENPDSLSKLSIKSLSGLGGTGKFALVFGEKTSLNQMEVILLQNKDFANIIEIALFVPKGGNSFSVITRSLENDQELIVLNIWNNGGYIWNMPVYPKGRLDNLKGVDINATSFNFPPFCYKENPENEDEEYQGIEVLNTFINLCPITPNCSEHLVLKQSLPTIHTSHPTLLYRRVVIRIHNFSVFAAGEDFKRHFKVT